MLVTERDGLFPCNPNLGNVGGTHKKAQQPARARNKENGAKNAGPRNGIGTRVEDLWDGCPSWMAMPSTVAPN